MQNDHKPLPPGIVLRPTRAGMRVDLIDPSLVMSDERARAILANATTRIVLKGVPVGNGPAGAKK